MARYVGSAVALAGLGAGVPLIPTEGSASLILALAVLGASLVGATVWNARASGDALSVLSLLAVFYFVAFFVGGIFGWLNTDSQLVPTFFPSDLTLAVWIATAAWLLLAAGYVSNGLRFIHTVVPPFPRTTLRVPLYAVVLPLLAIGWIARLTEVGAGRYFHTVGIGGHRGAANWYLDTTAKLPLLALAVVGAHAFANRQSGSGRRQQQLVFWGLTILEVAWAVPTGSREAVITVLAAVIVVRYYTLGRLPSWKTILALTIFVIFIFFPFVYVYRTGTNYQYEPSTYLSRAADLTAARGPRATLDAARASVARLSDVTAVAHAIGRSSQGSPIAQGETYLWAPEVFIPRAIFPEKRNPGTFGNEFGREYNFIQPGDFETSIAITQVGEAYITGGWLALLVVMPILGSFYRVLNDYFGARRDDPLAVAVYAVSAGSLVIGAETIVALGLTGVVKQMIVLTALAAVVARLAGAPRKLHALERTAPTTW
jgi:hypothetical protein